MPVDTRSLIMIMFLDPHPTPIRKNRLAYIELYWEQTGLYSFVHTDYLLAIKMTARPVQFQKSTLAVVKRKL